MTAARMRNVYEDESGVIRALVDRLGHDLEPSILIGGWVTFVRAGGEISLDIDLITSRESRHKLEKLPTDLSPAKHSDARHGQSCGTTPWSDECEDPAPRRTSPRKPTVMDGSLRDDEHYATHCYFFS